MMLQSGAVHVTKASKSTEIASVHYLRFPFSCSYDGSRPDYLGSKYYQNSDSDTKRAD
jgi:hypothetical protein